MKNHHPRKAAEVSNLVNLTSHNMADCGLHSPTFVLEGFFLHVRQDYSNKYITNDSLNQDKEKIQGDVCKYN